MRAKRGIWLVAALFVATPATAVGAVPIPRGHYIFDTPQSNAERFPGQYALEDTFGKGWSLHIFHAGGHFTTFSFIEAELRCSQWESQHWYFTLDGTHLSVAGRPAAQQPVRIWSDGSFSGGRAGEFLGAGFHTNKPRKTSANPTGWLSVSGKFVTRRHARGWMLATSSDGCSSGWLPLKGRFLRHGWRYYLDRL